MPKLKCKADNCAYNYDWLCKKSFIDVDGVESKTETQTACMSYRNISDTKRDVEFASFDGKPSINTEIYCDAVNCVYEKNQKCYADRVEILADNNDLNKRSTHCQTFEPID
jgi:leucyl aminopeptidase (aminopeptidase T)